MKVIKLIGMLACGASFAVASYAEESRDAVKPLDAEQKINQFINGNLFGIQSIKKDANKRIVSVIAIGRTPLSSALTGARAKNQAFKKADANARAEFMKWLTTSVTYTRIDQDDIAIVQKGESLGDSGSGKSTETSEASELTQEQTISVASGFVKGMVQIGAGMSDDGEAVVVLGWNADNAALMDGVREQNVPKKVETPQGGKKEEASSGRNAKPKKGTSVSDAADEYF